MTNYKDIVKPRDINTPRFFNRHLISTGNDSDSIENTEKEIMEKIICSIISHFQKKNEWEKFTFDECQENIISVLGARLMKRLLDRLVKDGLFGYNNGKYFIENSLIQLISDKGFVIDYVIE